MTHVLQRDSSYTRSVALKCFKYFSLLVAAFVTYTVHVLMNPLFMGDLILAMSVPEIWLFHELKVLLITLFGFAAFDPGG